MQMCRRLQIPISPGRLLENLFALPGRGEGSAATILIAPLCPGIVAALCVKLTASLSARFHSVGRETAEQTTHTHTA